MQRDHIVPHIFNFGNPACKVGIRATKIEFDIAASVRSAGIAVIAPINKNVTVQLDLPRTIGIDGQNSRKIHCTVTAAECGEDAAPRIQDFDIASLELDRAVFMLSCRIIIDPLHGNRTARNIDILRHRRTCRIGLRRGDRRSAYGRWHKCRAQSECKGDLRTEVHLFVVCIRLHV